MTTTIINPILKLFEGEKMKTEMNHIVISYRSNEIIISEENCRLEILSIGADAHGRRHILLKSHPLEKGTAACAQQNEESECMRQND